MQLRSGDRDCPALAAACGQRDELDCCALLCRYRAVAADPIIIKETVLYCIQAGVSVASTIEHSRSLPMSGRRVCQETCSLDKMPRPFGGFEKTINSRNRIASGLGTGRSLNNPCRLFCTLQYWLECLLPSVVLPWDVGMFPRGEPRDSGYRRSAADPVPYAAIRKDKTRCEGLSDRFVHTASCEIARLIMTRRLRREFLPVNSNEIMLNIECKWCFSKRQIRNQQYL